MKGSFSDAFADFLEERLGNALYELRERNEEYRRMSDEYAALFKDKYHTIGEYQQSISKISEIGARISDIEKRYLFLLGMREFSKMEEAVSSSEFEKLFVE